MPRAFDLRQPQRDHDPLANLLDFGNIDQTAELAGGLIKQYLDGLLDGIVEVIKDLTGLDLSALADVLQGLDFSSPEAFLQSLMQAAAAIPEVIVGLVQQLITRLTSPEGAEDMQQFIEAAIQLLLSLPEMLFDLATGLVNAGAGLLGIDSPLNSELLYNLINPNILGELPFGHIGETVVNLLANPSFEGAVSVQGSGLWHWDAAAGRTTPGSVYTTAAGASRQLVSNKIPVSAGQKLSVSIYTMWAGLAYTGTDPFKIQIRRLLNYAPVGTDDLFTGTTPAANQASWIQAAADYTVPAGCDAICLQLTVADTATAGTIRFDDGDIHKTGSVSTFIPNWNVTGVGGGSTIGDTVHDTWDKLISGFVDSPGGTGAVLPDLFGIGNTIASWAARGNYSFDILGIRNNKSLNTGFLPTSDSNVRMDSVALQPTAPTFGITSTTAITAYQRISESVDKGVVSWQGYGSANITDLRINIYKMNTATGLNTLVHASTNQNGLLTGGSVPVPVTYSLPTSLPILAGEVFGIEIVVRGTGTHNIVGAASWLQDQAVYPRRFSSVRDSSSVLAPATFTPTYGSNVPFIEFGVSAGSVSTPHSDTTQQIVAAGASSVPIPTWANFVDVVAIGGGGGGGKGGLYGIAGQSGGGAGQWATGTWARGTDFSGATTININVGDGGAQEGGLSSPGTVAPSTTAAITGHTVTAAGGAARDSGSQKGAAAGNQVYRGVTYTGGGAQNSQPGDGVVPGGGGSSGNDVSGSDGGDGAKGRVWLVFRQT